MFYSNPPVLSVAIPYSFTNRTGSTVYIPNCHGGFSLSLERLDGDSWTHFWSPVLLMCLSPAITIAHGATFEGVVHAGFGPPGSSFSHTADPSQLTGTFRIVWHDALSSYQDRVPFGEPIDRHHRLSNEFQLSVQ